MKNARNMRSFSLNSDEAYQILCPRADRPWIMNGSLPRTLGHWDPEPVVIPGKWKGRRGKLGES